MKEDSVTSLNRFYVLARLYDGEEFRLITKAGLGVAEFATHHAAHDWCCNHIAPDWNWIIVPFKAVEIGEGSCDCAAHSEVAGTPKFEDQVVHVRVRCTRCYKVFWQVYNHEYNIYKPADYSLKLER